MNNFNADFALVSWREVKREGDFVFMRRGTGETDEKALREALAEAGYNYDELVEEGVQFIKSSKKESKMLAPNFREINPACCYNCVNNEYDKETGGDWEPMWECKKYQKIRHYLRGIQTHVCNGHERK